LNPGPTGIFLSSWNQSFYPKVKASCSTMLRRDFLSLELQALNILFVEVKLTLIAFNAFSFFGNSSSANYSF